ncbi:hypothetical protein BDF20DRAFT_917745 [Mycotypha africana]|uniref:uncharacterized protein n=1 Tax=Mycotypha africana TaxID=64632 RepID=UPI0023015F04|nr:uncharacterized protein BDF20DRAFT_917745 [Mycotypha africana]KAI8967277.1 hypothetical protein BDF20DRAFT_917745 [Mycotypha africana]
MSNRTSDNSASKKALQKAASSNKPSAISKQVLKTNPIPQSTSSGFSALGNPASSNLTKKLHALSTDNKGKGQPLRSTKVSQKLVLFPQASAEHVETQSTLPTDGGDDNEAQDALLPSIPTTPKQEEYPSQQQQQLINERRPSAHSVDEQHWQDEQSQPRTAGVPLPLEWTLSGSRTQAERMTKEERELALLPRAAAYCTGEGYDLNRLRTFLRQHHRVAPRLYDECLYGPYHFPLRTLRPDKSNAFNIRVRSSNPPPPSYSNKKNTTAREEYEGQAQMIEEEEEQAGDPHILNCNDQQLHERQQQRQQEEAQQEGEQHTQQQEEATTSTIRRNSRLDVEQEDYPNYNDDNRPAQTTNIPATTADTHTTENKTTTSKPQREPFKGGEVFIFDYGVVVFWNFRRAEELLMLEDFMPFSIEPFRDNPDEDMQIEELHFQYDTSDILKPRIFNDMITLKSRNHMIKLTLSHGLAQSAVVARYEDIMDKTIEDTKHLPKEMAETGRLGKTRTEITKINGQLFNLRMNVNLVSNVLDTPEIFWSEPALQPMYSAIRDYLEIPQRAKILNDRLKVISDLLSMLREHLTNFGVEYQTLIIIYLIIVAVVVACFEIAVKILQSIDVL